MRQQKTTINRFRILLFAVLMLVGSTSAGWAATYYVSPSGNNTNNGTSTSAAFKTVQKALDVVRPGDTVNIMAGTYSEALVLKTTGSRNSRITIKNYDNGSVTISSGNSRAVRLGVSQVGYYTFSGLNFVSNFVGAYTGDKDYSIDLGIGNSWWGYGPPSDNAAKVTDDSNGNNGHIIENCNITGSVGIMGHFNIVRNCTFDGKKSFTNAIHDIAIVSHNNTYTNNTIANYTQRGIWSMSNVSDNVITYNDISHYSLNHDAGAIDLDGAWLPVQNIRVAYNTIHDPDAYASTGILLENGMNSIIDGNIIYNTKDGIASLTYTKSGSGGNYAFGYYDFQSYDPSHLVAGVPYVTNNIFMNNLIYNTSLNGIQLNSTWNEFVYNNTFYNCNGQFGAIALTNGGTWVGTRNITIQNNIIANSSSGVMVESGGSILLQTNNLFYGNKSNGQTGSSYQTGNPMFADPGAFKFALTTGSSAIGKGAAISTVTTDILGKARPKGSNDIGAYAFATQSKLPPPRNLIVVR